MVLQANGIMKFGIFQISNLRSKCIFGQIFYPMVLQVKGIMPMVLQVKGIIPMVLLKYCTPMV